MKNKTRKTKSETRIASSQDSTRIDTQRFQTPGIPKPPLWEYAEQFVGFILISEEAKSSALNKRYDQAYAC